MDYQGYRDDGGASEAEAAAGMAQLAASGRTIGSAQPTGGNHVGALQNLGNTLIALARKVPLEMMHKGWILEKTTWEDKTRAARSIYGISDAMVHFEDWIALDYPANSEMADIRAWSLRMRSITSMQDLHAAVKDFERIVSRTVQSEQRALQASAAKVERPKRSSRAVSGSLDSSTPTTSYASTQPSEGRADGKKELHHGRWSTDRYEGAVASLVHILRVMQATSPDACVLRPALREEARKAIGDTGLLDHLLKHLADKTVSSEGDKLRRRHNAEGHMEYWLQSAAAAQSEEEDLQQEAAGLASEFREVRKLRRLLAAARQEATQALTDAQAGGTTPGDGAESGCAQCMRLRQELHALQAQVSDMQSANVAEFEEVRREGAQFMQLLASHVGQAASAADAAAQHVNRLNRELALSVEEMRGRFEALTVAQSDIPHLRNEQQEQKESVQLLQQEVTALGKGLVLLHATILRRQPWQQQQQQGATQVPTDAAAAAATAAQAVSGMSSPLSAPQTPDFGTAAEANALAASRQQTAGAAEQLTSFLREHAAGIEGGMHAGANGDHGKSGINQ